MILNKNEKVFAKVENVDKPEVLYHGVDTETASVNVDNVNKEISVDVKFTGMLGETPTTAYPGHLGVQNKEDIKTVDKKVQAEVERATQAEASLKRDIENVSKSISSADDALFQLISNERNRALLAEKTLHEVDAVLDDSIQEVTNEMYILYTELDNSVQAALNTQYQKLSKQDATLDNKFSTSIKTLSDSVEDIEAKFSDISSFVKETVKQEIEVTENTLRAEISEVDETQTAAVETLKADVSQLSKVDAVIYESINSLRSDTQQADQTLRENVDKQTQDLETVKQNYATKEYVHSVTSSLNNILMMIVDSVDVYSGIILQDGKILAPQPGTIYLVPVKEFVATDIYKEYTLIDGALVCIGDTTVNLSEYATKVFVLTHLENYAKIEDVPTLDEFVKAIPETYVTEPELELKNYTNKSYVDTELAKKAQSSHSHKLSDISDYVAPHIPTSLSELTDDVGYALNSTVEEKFTEVSSDLEYISTDIDELSDKFGDYYTKLEVKSEINQAVSGIKIPDVSEFITQIPDEYVTEFELSQKGYLTEHQDISGKSEVGHTHSISEVTDYTPPDMSDYAKLDYVNSLFSNIKFIDGGTSLSIS